jgi:hypothetical protein
MPSSTPDAAGEDAAGDATDQSRWRRLTGSMSNMMLRPAVMAESSTGEDRPKAPEPTTEAEIEEAIKRASDKERLWGLILAPIAAGIGFVVTAALVHNDPAALYANGQVNPHHTNPTLYTELGLLSMAFAIGMLASAWFRKRILIGATMAMYGLSLFNLHYWGFGVPYIMFGSWYLVRAYRLSQKLKLVKTDGSPSGSAARRPQQNKRYTPPTATRTPKPKPGKEIAG